MESLIYTFGIILLIYGISTILNNTFCEVFPQLYTKDDIKYIKSVKFGSITSIIGLYVIGPSILIGLFYLSIFPICYFISKNKKVVGKL